MVIPVLTTLGGQPPKQLKLSFCFRPPPPKLILACVWAGEVKIDFDLMAPTLSLGEGGRESPNRKLSLSFLGAG